MNSLANIVNSGTAAQRQNLMTKIQSDGLGYSSAYAYVHGQRTPKLLYQVSIRKHVKNIYGLSVPIEVLFPIK